MKRSALIIVGLLLSMTVAQAETASLRMRFALDPSSATAQAGNFNANPLGKSNQLEIDPDSNGIRNVVVYVYTGRGGTKLKIAPHKGEQLKLTIAENGFHPHVVLARLGDTLEILNRSPRRHFPQITFFNAPAVNIESLPGRSDFVRLPAGAPTTAAIECLVTPSLNALLLIMDHPFGCVSDKNGAVAIEGLPVGTKLIFRVWHEAGHFNHVKIYGDSVEWRRSRFELTLAPGVNDFGDVLVSGQTFQK
ncbi:hypothetical protein K227x_01330 [Rubripirellula lacrimiformis]|uniref:Uncharacterized protein n=1 Tax=Rubripirellula lacrimiformis TaxID=1930273 RepID=A0A517N3Q8_9BACT|nr:hypothetical protein [Rubripirellula lacrimiformis]QDT01765.1 hypothetical protein K227x_01330 [Rubripirellula lacrimiformis]